MTRTPVLGPITRTTGVAGQIAYTVEVTYPDEAPVLSVFVSNIYGGPVVMISPHNVQRFVSDPERFGTFSPEWVRRFYA